MGHGEAGRVGVDEGEGFFFSVKTSSFTTDKSDRWKPIKKKNPTHKCLASLEKFLSFAHSSVVTAGC